MILISDKVIFPAFLIALAVVVGYAIAKEQGFFTKPTGVRLTVKRGEKTWGYFYIAYGIASVVLLQVINSAESLEDYKTFISLAGLAALFYLAFFNSWSRNKIVGIINKSQLKEERYKSRKPSRRPNVHRVRTSSITLEGNSSASPRKEKEHQT